MYETKYEDACEEVVDKQCTTTTQRKCATVEETVCDGDNAPQAAAAPSNDIDSYGAPAADAIDSYGAPQATPCRQVAREQCFDEPVQVTTLQRILFSQSHLKFLLAAYFALEQIYFHNRQL